MTIQTKLKQIEDNLNQMLFERNDEIRGLSLATLTGLNILFLGPPGVAKSMLVRLYQKCISGTKRFETLVGKSSPLEQLLGPFSLLDLKEGKYIRLYQDYLPDAHFAFIDETFKANATCLNSLLSIMNERIFKNGTEIIQVPLITLAGASNELPEDMVELGALYDRFHLKYLVKPIANIDNFIKMLTTNITPISDIITLDEIYMAKKDVQQVLFPKEMQEIYIKVIKALAKEQLMQSDRTYKLGVNILKASAYMEGRNVVNAEDFYALKDLLWKRPEDINKVYNILIQEAQPFIGMANEIFHSISAAFQSYVDDADPNKKSKKAYEVAEKLKDAKKRIEYVCSKIPNNENIKQFIKQIDAMLKQIFIDIKGF